MTNFKTAEQLRITEEEYDALLKTLQYFETSEPPTAEDATYGNDTLRHFYGDDLKVETRIGFNMNYEARLVNANKFDCGAVACIGGHMSLHMQGVPVLTGNVTGLTAEEASIATLYVNVERSPSLRTLFFPDQCIIDAGNWGYIEPKTAALAIRGFLTTGGADWRQALHDGGQEGLIGADVVSDDEDVEDIKL